MRDGSQDLVVARLLLLTSFLWVGRCPQSGCQRCCSELGFKAIAARFAFIAIPFMSILLVLGFSIVAQSHGRARVRRDRVLAVADLCLCPRDACTDCGYTRRQGGRDLCGQGGERAEGLRRMESTSAMCKTHRKVGVVDVSLFFRTAVCEDQLAAGSYGRFSQLRSAGQALFSPPEARICVPNFSVAFERLMLHICCPRAG